MHIIKTLIRILIHLVIQATEDVMEYFEDKDFKYEKDIMYHLRSYNQLHLGERESSNEYFYALEGDDLIGAVYTSYFWDWVGIVSIFYDDINTLNALISGIKNYYIDRAVGIKIYTQVKARASDFVSVGFEVGGIIEGTPKIPEYYYLKTTDLSDKSYSRVNVVITNDRVNKYHKILLEKEEKFNKHNSIHESLERNIVFAALDKGSFVGGVQGIITEDSMYVSRLVVIDSYKNQGMGRNLMLKIEDKAKELGLYSMNLGTVEFQAKNFYEKIGYSVILTKENDPKGYKSYTMIKKLNYI